MDRNNLIKTFKEQWLLKAQGYHYAPQKIQKLIPIIQSYILKRLVKVKGNVTLLIDYVKDIYSERNNDYNGVRLLFVITY